ncbi:MAG: hypothetical protein JSS99_07420 [Actinobacteria bacterium]|nr:hypothetical protein [Actinomycetota bacterium]
MSRAIPDVARESVDRFVDAAPQPQRSGLRLLVALERRPRGRRLLGRVHTLDQLANGLVAMGRYEDPANAVPLGWDADAIAARGRALRRQEGRP